MVQQKNLALQVRLQKWSVLPYEIIAIFPLKDYSNSLPSSIASLFNWDVSIFDMNKRFIIVGVVLGIIVTLAVIIGSPAIGGFDAMR
jgi:hypothetical protein